MNAKQAQFLYNAMEYAGQECEIYKGYSGRGMGDQTTCGVVLDNPLNLVKAVFEFTRDSPEDCEDMELSPLRFDSLGHQHIVY